MSKPTPGRQYIITESDTSLLTIAAQAYGDSSQWVRIKNANQNKLKSVNPEDIVVGETIIIPTIPENERRKILRKQLNLNNKRIDQMTVVVGDIEIPKFTASLFKAIDAAAIGWVVTFDWIPGINKKLDNLIKPYSYSNGSIYIGNKLQAEGILYVPITSKNNDGSIITLEFWTKTADMIDSNLKPPYERSKITLKELAIDLAIPHGIDVIYDVDEDEPFDRVTASGSDTEMSLLLKHATQRGVLVTTNATGDLILTKSNPSKTVGTLEEGQPGISIPESRFDGRKRFNSYRGTSQSPFNLSQEAVAKDDKVPLSRFKNFKFDDTTDGNIQKATDWKKSKTIADSLIIPVDVTGWIAPDGTVWNTNKLVTLISPTLFLSNGFTFLTRSVEFKFDEDGKTIILGLVPPQLYTQTPFEEPWSVL